MSSHRAGQRCEPHATSAWISPDGVFYHVNFADHALVADLMDSSVTTLENKGWLHLSFVPFGTNLFIGREPTQAQQDAVWDVYLDVMRTDPTNMQRLRALMDFVESGKVTERW